MVMEDTRGRVIKHKDRKKNGRIISEIDYNIMESTAPDEKAVKEFRRKPYSMEERKRRK